MQDAAPPRSVDFRAQSTNAPRPIPPRTVSNVAVAGTPIEREPYPYFLNHSKC